MDVFFFDAVDVLLIVVMEVAVVAAVAGALLGNRVSSRRRRSQLISPTAWRTCWPQFCK